MDTTKYKSMCYDILNNNMWYRKIDTVFLDNSKKKLFHLLYAALQQGAITKNIWDYC